MGITTLSLNASELEQLQQLAGQLGIMAMRGRGTGTLGSLSGFTRRINDTYMDDPARTLTLLARLFQPHQQRPDVFGYWRVGDEQFVVRWTAQHPQSKHGEAVVSVVSMGTGSTPPHSPNGHDQYIVPNMVTEEDMQWLQESGVTVQRAEAPTPALRQEQNKLMLV